MDISPQPDATCSPNAATPPPQPQFTPAWTKPSAASTTFSFSSGSALPTPERPAARQSPRTRRQASKLAADLPKSRFMPQDATDTTTSAAAAPAASGLPDESQPGFTGSRGNAPLFGTAAQTQRTSAGTAGTSDTAGTAGASASAGIRASAGIGTSAGTAGIGTSAGTAGIGTSAGTAGSAASARQHPAELPFRKAFGGSSSQAAPNGFPWTAASRSATAFPFSVPGRPMDSRIKDACAMGFMGINLDSTTSASDAGAGSSSQGPPAAGSPPSTTGSGAGATAGWSLPTADPSSAPMNQDPYPPQASFHFQSAHNSGFSAGFAGTTASEQNTSSSNEAPAADPQAPPSPFSFHVGAKATPKPKQGRAMFGSEHVATNLHEKLVLQDDVAAAAEPAAAAESSLPPRQHATSADASTLAAQAPAEPAVRSDTSFPPGQHATSANASTSAAQAGLNPTADKSGSAAPNRATDPSSAPWPAFHASSWTAPAAGTAEQPSFVFGTKPQAASGAQPSQPPTFSFSAPTGPTAISARSAGAGSTPFVFGASASTNSDAQPATDQRRPPPGEAPKAAANEAAAQPASVNNAVPQSSGWSASTGRSILMQFSAGQASSSFGPRNGLHSPSGIAKHTGNRSSPPGAWRPGRAVPGSPGVKRSAKVSPGKKMNDGADRAALPNRWVPVDFRGDPKAGSQWASGVQHSADEQAEASGQQQQVRTTSCSCTAQTLQKRFFDCQGTSLHSLWAVN
ncbi:hypothetical protein ABBQ38_011998 [Trebouxia sp. C0009 RCD-2024]